MRELTGRKRRPQRAAYRKRRVAGDKIVSNQSSIGGDRADGDGFYCWIWRDGVDHHILAVSGTDVARCVNHPYLIEIVTIGQRAAVVIAPGRAGNGKRGPGYAAVDTDLRRLVTGKRGGERAVDHHRADAGDKVAGAKASVGLQGIDINTHRRGAEIDSNGVIAAAGVANSVAHRGVNHVGIAVRQRGDIGAAEGVAPATAGLYRGSVGFAV